MSMNRHSTELQEPGGRSVIGVHLDIDSLGVVEMNQGRVARWTRVPYPDDLLPSSKEYPEFLKRGLDSFHSGGHHAALWVVASLPSLQVRFLSLPKARPGQLSSLVYWTFRREIPFDSAQTVFDYDVEGDVTASGQGKKLEATAYTVAQGDVHALVELFDRAGLRVDGVVIPSFAVRNLFRARPPSPAGTTLGLFVGSDASALLFFKGRHVVAHRVFKTGMNVMLDVLRDRHPDWSPARTYRIIRGALAATGDETRAAGTLSDETNQISGTVHVAFGRLIQQVERSMSAYLVGKGDEEIKDLYVAGSLAGLPELVRELGSKLGLASRPMDLVQPDWMDGTSSPPEPEETGMMAIALGAALSDPAHTPNLLHTYVKRAREARAARWRLAAIASGVIGLVLLTVAGGWLGRHNHRLQGELDSLQAQIKAFAPYPDRAMIGSMVAQAMKDSRQLKNMAARSLPVAALNQLALGTPEDIRLVSVSMERDASGKESGGALKQEPCGASKLSIRMSGMVRGAPGAQESKLAAYILRLEGSDMFEQVDLTRSAEGREGGEQVLLFDLDMRMDDIAENGLANLSPNQGVAP